MNPDFDTAVRLKWLADREKYLVGLLDQCRDHCVCDRNVPGFDYGERHAKLGKPKAGARWFTPSDIVETMDRGEIPEPMRSKSAKP